jgi:large subunit ribosomal protein L4e
MPKKTSTAGKKKKKPAAAKKYETLRVYTIEGKVKKYVKLPDVFREPYRADLVRKAVAVLRKNRRQPYGASPTAGKRYAVEWAGKGRGVSRVPRLQNFRAAFAPGTVGGRRAHPPKAEKKLRRKLNRKENAKARRVALAATHDRSMVRARGHRFDEKVSLPIIIEDAVKELTRTKQMVELLERLGVYADINRAKEGTKVRAGRGKLRGRRYRVPRSLLIVVHESGVCKAARNLPGVDVVTAKTLNVEHLAPGGAAGRLAMFTESAFGDVVARWQSTPS